jgi:hypothetical protein
MNNHIYQMGIPSTQGTFLFVTTSQSCSKDHPASNIVVTRVSCLAANLTAKLTTLPLMAEFTNMWSFISAALSLSLWHGAEAQGRVYTYIYMDF